MELLTTLALAVTLSVPARTSAHVSLAAQGATVVAAWSATLAAGQMDIYAAVSRDGGATFGAPIRVNSTDGAARANGEQPPRVILTRRSGSIPGIVVIWTAPGKEGTALLTAKSDDGGKSFGKAVIVPGSDAPGNRGWQSAAADSRGVVHALWLDHRGLVAPAAPAGSSASQAAVHAGHAAKPGSQMDGAATAQLSAIYTSAIGDGASPHAIAKGVCYCCKTAIVAGADGAMFTAWRQVYAGNVRDIAAAVSRDGGRTFTPPVKVSEDGWVLNGCPDDGPAMAADASGRLHIVWPTLVPDAAGAPTLALFYASSRDGRTFSARQKIATGAMPHHPQIAAAADGSLALAWDESGPGARQVVIARAVSDAAGRLQLTQLGASVATPGTYPVVAVTSDGVVAAWTSAADGGSAIKVQRIEPR